MDIFLQPEAWIALLTLTFLEIVLGIDNIIFISIVSGKLPKNKQGKARTWGLLLAMVFRVLMLLGINWVIGFDDPLFTIFKEEISGRDLILLIGGLFLLSKSTSEIHGKITGQEHGKDLDPKKKVKMSAVLTQIVLLDVIFSFDSILTAVGMTEHIIIMIIAVVVALGIMMIFAGKIAAFINKYPTLQILALSFLILIGVMLMVESFDVHVPKGYIYFAVFFSLIVELVNINVRKRKKS